MSRRKIIPTRLLTIIQGKSRERRRKKLKQAGSSTTWIAVRTPGGPSNRRSRRVTRRRSPNGRKPMPQETCQPRMLARSGWPSSISRIRFHRSEAVMRHSAAISRKRSYVTGSSEPSIWLMLRLCPDRCASSLNKKRKITTILQKQNLKQ